MIKRSATEVAEEVGLEEELTDTHPCLYPNPSETLNVVLFGQRVFADIKILK